MATLLSGSEFLQCGAETADDALLAKRDHGIEERRRNGLADDGDADRIDQQAGFDAAGFGDGAAGVIAGVMIPFGKRGERVGGFGKEVGNFRVFPKFVLGGLLVAEIVGKERA